MTSDLISAPLTAGHPDFLYDGIWRCSHCGNPIQNYGGVLVHVKVVWKSFEWGTANWGQMCLFEEDPPSKYDNQYRTVPGRVATIPNVTEAIRELEAIDLNDDE